MFSIEILIENFNHIFYLNMSGYNNKKQNKKNTYEDNGYYYQSNSGGNYNNNTDNYYKSNSQVSNKNKKNQKKEMVNEDYYEMEPQIQQQKTEETKQEQQISKLSGKEEITDTLVFFPGEKYPFNQELLNQGNFFLQDGQLVSKNFFSLSICKNNKVNFNMSSQLQGKYYSPKTDDMVIGTIISKNAEQYKVDIKTYTHAILSSLEFEGATKKSKPNLKIGDLIFAKVSKVNKYDSPLLTCISNDGKSWSSGEAFFGVINEGNLFSIPLNMVNLYFYFGDACFKRINDACEYEFSLGHNGQIVVNCQDKSNIKKVKEIINDWGKLVLQKFNKGEKLNEENCWFPELEKKLNNFFIK